MLISSTVRPELLRSVCVSRPVTGHGAYEDFTVGGFLVVLAFGVFERDTHFGSEIAYDEMQVFVLAECAAAFVF